MTIAQADKIDWLDESTGLACIAWRHPEFRHWCGYVGVPSGHPLYRIEADQCSRGCPPDRDRMGPLDDEDSEYAPLLRRMDAMMLQRGKRYIWRCEHRPEMFLEVHGGVTFAGTRTLDRLTFAKWWFFGFDCAHANDLIPMLDMGHSVYRDLDFVRSECADLAKQLADLMPAPPASGPPS